MVTSGANVKIDFQAMLDGMGQGVLVFDADDALVVDNLAARRLLGGANLARIRAKGWRAWVAILDAETRPDEPEADELRAQALRRTSPIRFHMSLAGAYTPGWMSAIYGQNGQMLTQVCLETPDWTALTELMDSFRSEARMSISSTRGHAELITQMMRNLPDDITVEGVAQRVLGFSEIMGTHMYRLDRFMDLLHRLEIIRIGRLAADVSANIKCIVLAEWTEDFLEDLLDQTLVDPEAGSEDYRERLVVNIPEDMEVAASPPHLANVLRDMLHNAVLYSEADAPIMLEAKLTANGRNVRIDVIDRGYGVRSKEAGRVFVPFERARQPQIIGQFGYGLSLYLVKAEVEAMGGRIWFESEEGMGSTFSVRLPTWETAQEALES